jgi:hypothetical protein
MAYSFPMEHQQQNDWCWNAVAVSMAHYFAPDSKLTQDELAAQLLHIPLKQAATPLADQPDWLQSALAHLDLLGAFIPRQLSFSEIQQQLVQKLPVCAHIVWNEGGGSHYVVISGYHVPPSGGPQLYVSDPLLQPGNVSTFSFDWFCYDYSTGHDTSGEGTWVDTCLVKQKGA